MASHALLILLEKYPQLRPMIEQGRFLLGYTNGSSDGQNVSVFLLRSPWTQFCIQATACDLLIPGGVLVLTHDLQWSPESNWKAYSMAANNLNRSHYKNATHQRHSMRSVENKLVSPMTTLAAEIATEVAKKAPARQRMGV